MATIMENKEKTATSGDEDVQIQDDTTPSVVQKPSIQTGTRKTISSSVDLGNLPSRRGLKKHKPNKTPLRKVPKFTPSTVDLDDPMVNVAPVQTIPPIQYENLPPPTKASRRAHPSKPSKRSPNLVLDEGYSWKTFKGIITDNEVNSCYNLLARDFEHSAIHDLFKAMSKFYMASSRAKELCDEAKMAKEKNKELNNEVLLKKGEVIRLIEDLNYFQGIEMKLKDEVEELKADSIEKETALHT